MNAPPSDVITVIPMKSLSKAKSRLIPYLERNRRERLVLNMLRQVIGAAIGLTEQVRVIGFDPTIQDVATNEGAAWYPEEGTDVNESLRLAFQQIWKVGKTPLFLPGDLPFIQREDVEELIATAPRGKNGVLSPARAHGGTNAILIPQPSAFRPQLGPGSFHRHLEQATSLGLKVAIHFSPGLALDLDTWEDLQEYQSMEPKILDRLRSGANVHGSP